MKTSELTGALLDYWVIQAGGIDMSMVNPGGTIEIGSFYLISPSTNWAQCGPLIDKYEIYVSSNGIGWEANCQKDSDGRHAYGKGRTAQEAICRAVVLAAFGDEVPEVAS